MDSDVAIEEGLIDGLFTSLGQDGDNILSWGHATHVGCGWIQFPTSTSEDEKKDGSFENFMVCNYAIGKAERTSCDANSVEGNVTRSAGNASFISYYAASSQVIEDIKLCLGAISCRRRQLDFDFQARGGGGGGDGGRSCDQK